MRRLLESLAPTRCKGHGASGNTKMVWRLSVVWMLIVGLMVTVPARTATAQAQPVAGSAMVTENAATNTLPSLSNIQAIAAGNWHTCALTSVGGVKCWGWNDSGELGDGTTGDENQLRLTPVDVVGLSSGVTVITAGQSHTCALTSGGGVKCWGANWRGQLGDGTEGDENNVRLTPVDVVGLGSGITAVATGERHTCALTASGGVQCWGANELGALGDGTRGDENNERLTPVQVVGLGSGVSAIATGQLHTCTLTSVGGVKCWGHNDSGQLGDGTEGTYGDVRLKQVQVVGLGSGVSAIAAGRFHTCALTSVGGVKCWGHNDSGQLGDGTGGTYGDVRLTPVQVVGLGSGVSAIATDYDHTCALTSVGGVKCWGANHSGQLGDGTTGDTNSLRLTAVDVVGLSSGVMAIDAGASHTCAVTSGGGVKCWGYNGGGRLGDGTTGDANGVRLTPVDVVGLGSGVTAITTGYAHTCALTSVGGVKCWGWNDSGELGDGTTETRLTPVDVVAGQRGQGTLVDLVALPTGTPGEVMLEWNAPSAGDNPVASYDIRYSSGPIDDGNWDSATQVTGEPTPGSPGADESMTLTSLATKTRWYVAMRAIDSEGNVSALSNVPSLYDWGFRPNPQGYSFDNYGGTYPLGHYDYRYEDMIRMFGQDNVCRMAGAVCLVRFQAHQWHVRRNLAMKGGLCYGMAATSSRFFDGADSVGSFQAGAVKTYDLDLGSSRRHIAYHFVMQFTEPSGTYINTIRENPPSNIVEQLYGIPVPPILFVYAPNMRGGHAVTPYALSELGNEITHIYVYDNNHPYDIDHPDDHLRYVTVDGRADTWSYEGKSGDAQSDTFGFVPMTVHNQPAACPWCEADAAQMAAAGASSEVWVSGGQLLIKNEAGQRIGHDGETFVNEIEGAYANPIIGGLEAAEPNYVLPMPGTYQVQLRGEPAAMGAAANEPAALFQLGQRYSSIVDEIALTPDTQDTIIYAEDGSGVRYQASEAKQVSVQMAAEDAEEGYLFTVSGVDLADGRAMDVRSSLDTGKLVVDYSEAIAGAYSIEIVRRSAEGEEVFAHADLAIGENEAHVFDFGAWADEGAIEVCVDEGGDGVMDGCDPVENQAGSGGVYLPLLRGQ